MPENTLADLPLDFAVKTLSLTEPITGHSSIVNQLERNAASIGANIREAKYTHGKVATCCFSGHRPKAFPWGDNTSDPRCRILLNRIADAIDTAVNEGVKHFISGNALGVDTWAAQLVLLKKQRSPFITLEIALPYDGHNTDIAKEDAEQIKAVQAGADIVHIVTENKSHRQAFYDRDRYMVDHSEMLIAVYDDNSRLGGGTRKTLLYAREKNLRIIQIPWMDIQ